MLKLGAFNFSLETAAYQQLQRRTAYRWPQQQRFGRRPARQFTGPGDETIDLNGVIFPQTKGTQGQVEQLRTLAAAGEPLALDDSQGNTHGLFVVLSIAETRSQFFGDGTPRKIEFRLQLGRYGPD